MQRKLERPSLPKAFVPRPRLIEHLTRALSYQVTLVEGPPDSGKSCLVSHWLQETGIRACWLNLDSADNQLTAFLAYIVRATLIHFPKALPITQLILQLPDPPPFDFTQTTLINELADLPDSLVIVLDNYHLIHESEVTKFVRRLVNYQPDTIRLVILARGRPQLPLLRLRARQQIAEIGRTELAFNQDEAQAYLNLVTGSEVTPATTARLIEHTEGWVMGLYLAALDLNEKQMHDDEDPEAGEDNWHVDYFSQRILAFESAALQRFLLVSAIPQAFSLPLCDALLAGDKIELQSSSALEYLRRSGTFLVPHDTRPGWYRFHKLFHDALRHLGKEAFDRRALAGFHNRASAWLAANDYVEEALEHALVADNLEAAAGIMEAHIPDLLQREELALLRQLLQRLPPDLIQRRPSLLVAQAWCLQLSEHRAPIEPLLSAAETMLEKREASDQAATSDSLRGQMLALRSSYCYWYNQHKLAQTLADRALADLPAGHPVINHALCYRVLARQAAGHRAEATTELRGIIQRNVASRSGNLHPLLLADAHLSLYAAQLNRLQIAANNVLNYGARFRLPSTIAWGHYFLGRLHYERNHLDDAAEHFSTLVVGEPPFSRDVHGDALMALALIREANHDTDTITETIAALAALGETYKARAEAFRARQALKQGETESAIFWMETTPVPDASAYLFAIESPLLTRIWVLIALNRRDRALEAIRLLLPALQAAQVANNTLYVVKVLALRALALRTLGRMETALEVLDRAVTLASGGMVRTFLELGPPMAELLYESVHKQDKPDSYAGQLLEAFTTTGDTIHPLVTVANETLIEPLTERELEILQMLYHRLSNLEISQALEISPLTVKKHTINIYQKLNVQSRQDAVAAGSQLGLIFDTG
ncbi:MAG: LuxR C-terminal-related transcriptional regulator [Chloroflexota bacterium]|jgi:LuxR family maltose regulon positive regulatory protein